MTILKLTLKKLRQTILMISFILLSGGAGWWLGHRDVEVSLQNKAPKIHIVDRTQPSGKSDVNMSLFWEVWDKLEAKYLMRDKLDTNKMVYGAIAGMTASLEDPYTAFFPPKENKTAKENLNGSFGGVGIQLGYKKGKLAVISPLEGMPAKTAGVKAGDLILRIVDERKNIDKETTGMSLPEAVEIIRGPKGTAVKLTLLHEGEEKPYEAEITRGTIVVPSVEVVFGKIDDEKWVEDENGQITWLKLVRFGENTDSQWDEAVDKIKRNKNIGGLVLDVRNNPGGYLEGSVNLAGEFLSKGELIVKQERTIGVTEQEHSVNRLGRLTEVPMVVLINQGSASASEILAGALRDHDRAKLVGEKSFGKGTIQEAEDLRGGAGVHITVARWLTPEGTWVHDEGLTPDVGVEDDLETEDVDEQLVEAIKQLAIE